MLDRHHETDELATAATAVLRAMPRDHAVAAAMEFLRSVETDPEIRDVLRETEALMLLPLGVADDDALGAADDLCKAAEAVMRAAERHDAEKRSRDPYGWNADAREDA